MGQRQQKALEKADVNVDKLQSRIADSKARGKRVQARRKDWEELNENLGDGQKKRVGAAGEEEQVSRPRGDRAAGKYQGRRGRSAKAGCRGCCRDGRGRRGG